MVLNQDLREFIELLNENGVRYLVVGGYAVGIHGYPRYTKDIDIWVWLDKENAKKAVKVIHDFGFSALGLSESDFLDPENVIQLGYAPNRIDILTDLPGVNFDECFEKRKEEDMGGLLVKFIDRESLIITKKAAGRPQDQVDILKLQEGKGEKKKKGKK
jgi:predicted nucleotidyltransferase